MSESSGYLKVLIPLLAGAFSIILIVIIVLANRGELNQYIGFLVAFPYGDKLGHFLLMGTLSLLVNLSLKAKRFEFAQRRFLIGSFVVAAVVTAEELSQAFLPMRTLSLGDWLADVAGIVLFGQLAAWLIAKMSRVTEKPTPGVGPH